MPPRRNFLPAALAPTAAATFPLTNISRADELIAKPARPNRIAISTYSFWRFMPDSKVSIEDCIRQSAAMGFDAVEILHRQMTGAESRDNPDLDNTYLQSLKQ